MPETIKASEQNLNEVFSNKYLFQIPFYQRPYAWTTEEVGELLDDLLFAVDKDADAPYFLGSIVLIKGDGPDSQVIDGQQRLTTLTMLLCALRDLADDGAVRVGLNGCIRQERDVVRGMKEVVRLRLRPRDREFFHANVQNDDGIPKMMENAPPRSTDSQERIFENAKYLLGKLKELDQETLQRLIAYIIHHCYLVTVATADISSAYRIFSVMNDRGLALEPTDILKAEIVGEITTARQQEYSDKWENIEQELGRDRFGDLFGHIRMIFAKAKARRNLQDEFREVVLKDGAGTDFIDSILDPYADAYERALGVSSEHPADAGKFGAYLGHLRRLDNRDWIPPAMAFFHFNPHNLEQLAKFIKDLERLAYGLFIQRANINERISRYAAVLQTIERGGDDIWRGDSPLQLNADEKNAIVRILDGPVYGLPRIPQPLLLRLDGLLADAGARYDHSVISIEHVLPQNPREGSQWRQWFPDDEERAYWTHRLANLALLSHRKNAAASNWDFETKKSRYFTRNSVSPFALTSQVLAVPEWKPEVLAKRQGELLDTLKKEWRLE